MRYFYDGSRDEEDDDEPAASASRDERRGGRRDRLGDEPPDDESDDASFGGASLDDADDETLEDDDDSLDDDFPRGDGTADTEAVVFCPYCGELNEIAVDPGGGPVQSYVEDCHVCCRPWRVALAFDAEGHAVAQVEAADDM